MFGDPNTNPKKWETGKLEDVMVGKASNGFFTKPANYSPDGNVGVICVGDVVNRKYSNICDLRRANADEKQIQKFKVQYGDMLFCRSSLVKEGIAKASIVPKDSSEDVLFECHVIRVKLDLNRVIPEFMQAFTITDYFRIQMMDKSKTATMTTIGQKDVISGTIYIPDMDLQKLFVHFAAQSDKSKFYGKSQFIEMFGELGKDQKGWGLTTLGECCEVNPKRPRNIDEELMVSFVPMPSVSEDGKIDCSNIKPYKEVRKGFTYFAENDVLFAKITPCMENGKGAVAKGLSGGIGSGSTEFHVLRPIEGKSNPYWLYIITMFELFRVGARKVMTGTGGQLRVPVGYLSDFPISLPPISLQDSFEEFVHQSDKSKLSSIG